MKKFICKSVLLGITVTVLSSCSSLSIRKLEQPYSYEKRIDQLVSLSEYTRRADSFAQDLCVVIEPSAEEPSVTSKAAGVFGVTDTTVVYDKNVFERLYPASVTKIMTAYLALQYGNLTDEVTVTDAAIVTESGATLSGIKPGDVQTLEQLLYGLILPSGNDSGNAIAVHISGSVEEFSKLMNEEAHRMGATATHFMNPHGLNDEQHYTTAYDLYLIFRKALELPKFREIVGAVSYTANYKNALGEPVSKTYKGGNWYMIGSREAPEGISVLGGKTGTTKAAGYCLIMLSKNRDEKEYISVVLKADSRPSLYDNMTNIVRKIDNK